MAKLSKDNIISIQQKFLEGIAQKDLAVQFGVTQGRISQLLKPMKTVTVTQTVPEQENLVLTN